MSNNSFAFKQFIIHQEKCAMKVGTDAVLLGAWAKTYGVRRALDIGTGTGVIALMLAQKCGATIDAIDIDEQTAEEAKENVRKSPWHDRVHVQHISVQDFSKMHPETAEEKYDLIVSNPPYFSDSLPATEELRTKARHTVLLPFPDLIHAATKLLSKEGKFYVILPTKEGETFREMAEAKGLHLRRLTRVKTTPEKTEKRLLMQFGFTAKPQVSESTLVIEKDNLNAQHYTEEYIELTRAYYVNM
ncbi:MAG TPA: methyltransferase [Bacteroidia bacterium]|nr:methyltransferase [Bacteroidia bacterium]